MRPSHTHSPPGFTLRQLAYFVAAAEHGTISGAAASLHVSAPALSDAITELERALGEKLGIRRKSRGFELTSAGDVALTAARRVLAEAHHLGESLGGRAAELSGPIVVGCYPSLVPTIVPTLLADFGTRHPHVELTVIETTHDGLEERLDLGRVDIAFIYDSLVPGAPQRQVLFDMRPHVLLAGSHPLAGRPSIRLSELADEPLILYDAPPAGTHTLSLLSDAGVTPRVLHTVSSFEVMRTLVGRGLGYGLAVQRSVNTATTEGLPLTRVEIEPPAQTTAIEVIWSAGVRLPARARALVEFARTAFADAPTLLP